MDTKIDKFVQLFSAHQSDLNMQKQGTILQNEKSFPDSTASPLLLFHFFSAFTLDSPNITMHLWYSVLDTETQIPLFPLCPKSAVELCQFLIDPCFLLC